MSTTEKNKSLLFATLSLAFMIGSGVLLSWTLNVLYGTLSAPVTLSLSLLSVFIYIAGASLIGVNFRKSYYHSNKEVKEGIIFALLLIAAGTLMICFNAGVLNPLWKSFFLSWQMFLFVVGVVCFCRFHFIRGILATTAGIFFLIGKTVTIYPHELHYETFTSTYWPAIFIVLGIVIVLSFYVRPKKCGNKHHRGNWMGNYEASENENNDGKINYRFVFSGTEQVILDPVFRGGTIDATFGGLELDLRHTSLAEGTTVLNINIVFGGVEITAPDHWYIELVSKSFAGGVSDSRFRKNDIDRSRKLVIVANCRFGGITIK